MYKLSIILLILIVFLSGCSGRGASYYTTVDCDCEGDYHCISGLGEVMDYCVRDYDGWDGSSSGDKDFKEDIVNCFEDITITKNYNYSCWDIRQIIELVLNIPQNEARVIKECNYPQYSSDNIIKVDWKKMYIKECIGDYK